MANLMRRTWDPFAGLEPLFTNFGFGDVGFGPQRYAVPRHGMSYTTEETPDAILIRVDVPGISPSDLEVEIDGGTLAVCGTRAGHRQAIYLGVPDGTDATAAAAEVRDGVLTVTLPKTPEAKPRKLVVKAG